MPPQPESPVSAGGEAHPAVYRLKFAKTGRARFLSHLETAAALVRAIRRAGLPFRYSEGFHPHPKISFAGALPVGLESLDEAADIQLETVVADPGEVREKINEGLPEGIRVLEIRPAGGRISLHDLARRTRYEIFLAGGRGSREMQEKMEKFLAADSFFLTRVSKGKSVQKDIRSRVEELSLDREEKKIECTLITDSAGGVRPSEVLSSIFGLSPDEAGRARIIKIRS
jgi:radical SAM-linked protein